MTRNQEIELEIRNQAKKLIGKCAAPFELPLMVYTQIMMDNATRKKPFRVSEKRIQETIRRVGIDGKI